MSMVYNEGIKLIQNNAPMANVESIQKIIYSGVLSSEISNADLVQIIELCGNFLNLQTISNYAKNQKMSYNGVKNFRYTIGLFGVKFVIDNN